MKISLSLSGLFLELICVMALPAPELSDRAIEIRSPPKQTRPKNQDPCDDVFKRNC
ncbi:unnamed protein product [Cercospora beticola]|nr:unnamed protein product [Cercospora beticola]